MKVALTQMVSCRVYGKPSKIMQDLLGNSPYMLDCWADQVVYLLLLKSSMGEVFLLRLNHINSINSQIYYIADIKKFGFNFYYTVHQIYHNQIANVFFLR